MRILTDFHTHTIYSKNNHGKGTIRDNAEAAIKKGLKELWITDHGPSHLMFGIKRDKFLEVRSEIDRLNAEYQGRLKIYFGVEANVMSYRGENDISSTELQYLDGINLGFHYGIVNSDPISFIYFWLINPISRVLRFLIPWIREKNTDALINNIKNHDIQIITHPGDKVPINIKRLAKACEKYNTALEVNSSHKYLSLEDLIEIKDYKVMISIGSDAHRPESIGNFNSALKRIEQAGISQERILNLKK